MYYEGCTKEEVKAYRDMQFEDSDYFGFPFENVKNEQGGEEAYYEFFLECFGGDYLDYLIGISSSYREELKNPLRDRRWRRHQRYRVGRRKHKIYHYQRSKMSKSTEDRLLARGVIKPSIPFYCNYARGLRTADPRRKTSYQLSATDQRKVDKMNLSMLDYTGSLRGKDYDAYDFAVQNEAYWDWYDEYAQERFNRKSGCVYEHWYEQYLRGDFDD